MLVLVKGAPTAGAVEIITLASGFQLVAERTERAGSVVRLYARNGFIEVPADQVRAIEAVAPAPMPATATPAESRVSTPAPPEVRSAATPRELVEQAARKAGLPPELVRSLAWAESAFNPQAVSSKGAIGIMQLMPETAATLSVNPHDPEQNVAGGVRYLRELLERYDGDVQKALAAYNAGPGAVEKYQGIPPYRETVHYVDRVIRRYLKERPDQALAPTAPAGAPRSRPQPASPR